MHVTRIAKTRLLQLSAASAISLGAMTSTASASPASCAGAGDYGATLTCIEGGSQTWAATTPRGTATGAYQITFQTLEEAGFVAPNQARPGFGDDPWDNIQWTGKGGVNSRAEFLASPDAQNLALSEVNNINWRQVQGVSPVGTSVNGVPMTQAGVYATAHMLGPGGYQNWASCGFQASCLSQKQAGANGMSKEQLQQHLMERMAVMGNVDPSAITGGGGSFGGSGGMNPGMEMVATSLMPWTTITYPKTVHPGEM